MSENTLLIFLRAPRLGTVKTRLAAEVGADQALAIYRDLVARTLEVADAIQRVVLCVTPDDAGAELSPWRRSSWGLQPQGGGDLGSRLSNAIERAFASGAKRVVVIGTDCPTITASDLHEAFDALATEDLVLGPALDGGYWLIGLRRSAPLLFQSIDWSTDRVLRQTLERAEALNLRARQLRPLSDVDTLGDWTAFQSAAGANVTD